MPRAATFHYSDPHARADKQCDLLRLSRLSTFFSDRAVSHPHPESIMEMSNSHIKRREYEVAAGTDSDSTRHAGDVPSVSGEKEIIQLAAFEDHDADIPSNAGVINEHGIGMTAVDIEKDSQPAGLADNDPNIVWWDGDDDPENPLNWKPWKIWSDVYTVAVISSVT